MICETVATAAAGIFCGAAVYVNLVEQPARLSCGVPLAVTEWRPSYQRGTLMQAPLALLGSVSALVAWWSDGLAGWLVGGVLLLLVIPFTLIALMPSNKRLESAELNLNSAEAAHLLKRWGWLHAVRSVLSGATFLLFVWVLARKA